MVGVGLRHGDARELAPQDRKRCVHDREREDDEPREDEVGLPLLAEEQDDHHEQVADQEAAAVAEEDDGGVEVPG